MLLTRILVISPNLKPFIVTYSHERFPFGIEDPSAGSERERENMAVRASHADEFRDHIPLPTLTLQVRLAMQLQRRPLFPSHLLPGAACRQVGEGIPFIGRPVGRVPTCDSYL
jgi:hypothetical protein